MKTKSDEELRQERFVIRLWIRDITREKRARLTAIQKELKARKRGILKKAQRAGLVGR